MTGRRCGRCRGHSGAHFHWCPTLAPPPAPAARLGHHQAPASGLAVNDVPVIECTSAVLCPDCLGDWCPTCDWTGMARPSDSTAPAGIPEPLGGGRCGEDAPAAGVLETDLATAVARWCTETLGRSAA